MSSVLHCMKKDEGIQVVVASSGNDAIQDIEIQEGLVLAKGTQT